MGEITYSNDWNISIETVREKKSSMGAKYFRNYYIYTSNNEKASVNELDYSYITEGDQVYCVHDKKNELIRIYTPRMYNYKGKKVNSNEIEVNQDNNSNAIRYSTDIFILLCVLLFSIIIGMVIELILNIKYIDESERLFHKDPIGIRKKKRYKVFIYISRYSYSYIFRFVYVLQKGFIYCYCISEFCWLLYRFNEFKNETLKSKIIFFKEVKIIESRFIIRRPVR